MMSIIRSGKVRWWLPVGVAAALLIPAAPAPAAGELPLAAPAATMSDGPATAAYLHDVSQPIPGVTVTGSIVEHHRITAPDGVQLDSWIVRPPVAEPVPVVLDVTPYYGGGSPVLEGGLGHLLGRAGDVLVPRGYAYGIVSLRGTGNSEGCFTIGGPTEAKDTAAAIEHYGHQPWSNGRVGLMGVSYDGTAPQDVWVEAPPSLKTIVPISGISDLYKYNFVNGVPINIQGFGFNTYYWTLVGLSPVGLYTGSSQLRDPVSVPGAVAGEVCAEQVWVQEGGVSSTVDGNKDGYWQLRDFDAELRATPNRQRASVFYIHGLRDWNVKPHNMAGWLADVQRTGVPFKAWLGQWAHAWPARADWWEQVMVAWFDQFLKERDTGILAAPAIQMQDDAGRWRHEKSWLLGATNAMNLYPSIDGVLRTKPGTGPVHYYDYQGRLATEAEETSSGHGNGKVVFASAPLDRDITLSGMPSYQGTVTATGNRASLVLSLIERRADGTERPINWAAQSLNHVTDPAAGRLTVAGLPQKVSVDFFPQDTVIQAGSRIVLVAAGNTVGDQPSLQPVADGSTIVLDLADARLSLPVDTSLRFERS
ncbi:CocE/NonD family hydrolase [Micromonospora sp. NPDC007271]|uniref:CocE/NonD family hydrolase n=1 Tax=Micromonospora sp. NPDC007271 TaxID=3154587 RepID=UPI0033C31890